MDKSIDLKPSWKRWFWGYFFGFLLIPFFGLGLLVLWRVHNRKKSYTYRVTDKKITVSDKHVTQSVDLANIKNLDVEQNWLDRKLDIGDLVLTTETRSLKLLGQTDPSALSSMIARAIEAERARVAEEKKVKASPVEPASPGSLDRLDYLTGLWQQGLISDEDFKKEKKHFEG